jgi:hypothetical protein
VKDVIYKAAQNAYKKGEITASEFINIKNGLAGEAIKQRCLVLYREKIKEDLLSISEQFDLVNGMII